MKDSDDEDDAVQKALAESVKNMALNSRNKRSNKQNKLQKPQPGSSISKSVASRAAARKNNSVKLAQSGRSVEDMARLTSARAAEKSRKEEQRKKEMDSFIDEDLDRSIALSLEHTDDWRLSSDLLRLFVDEELLCVPVWFRCSARFGLGSGLINQAHSREYRSFKVSVRRLRSRN